MNQRTLDTAKKCSAAVSANMDLGMKIAENSLQSWLSRGTDQVSGSPVREHYKGITPRETIYTFDAMRVFRFQDPNGKIPSASQPPLLIVSPMINRSYILDLMEGSSLIGDIVARGIPTYLIDWGEPGPQHDHLHFDFFFNDLIGKAVRAVKRDTGFGKIHLLGYCMGGTMSLLHAALHPDDFERISLLATPVQFHDEGTLSQWAKPEVFPVDKLIATTGHMDSTMLQTSFLLLKPMSFYQKMKHAYETCVDPKSYQSFVKLESWVNDNVNLPGTSYAEYVKLCYHENALMKGRFPVAGREINLKNIRCPILNVMATKDHIVPIESSRILKTLVGGKVAACLIDSGHIGLVMGRKARAMFETLAHFYTVS